MWCSEVWCAIGPLHRCRAVHINLSDNDIGDATTGAYNILYSTVTMSALTGALPGCLRSFRMDVAMNSGIRVVDMRKCLQLETVHLGLGGNIMDVVYLPMRRDSFRFTLDISHGSVRRSIHIPHGGSHLLRRTHGIAGHAISQCTVYRVILVPTNPHPCLARMRLQRHPASRPLACSPASFALR